MNEHRTSLLRFLRWLARTLVDVWPAESRRWGQALAAESEAIQEPFAALRWALGGVTLFARAWTSHAITWLNLPIGARMTGTTTVLASGPAPRRSRLFTFALLAATAGLFLVPRGREAVRTITSYWPGFRDSTNDERILQVMAAKAERSQDARTLAFVALAGPPGCRGGICFRPRPYAVDVERLADRAVEFDPSLAWIYAGMVRGYGFRSKDAVWLTRMKAADQENGMVDLFWAEAISSYRNRNLFLKHAPSEREIEASVENDSEWLSHLQDALRAPRCESYSARMLELFREGYRKNPELSPSLFLRGFYGVREPGNFDLRTYVSILVRRGEEASSPGELRKAAEGLATVEHFGERIGREIQPYSGYSLGTWYQFEALEGQKKLFKHRGLTEEAAAASARLSKVKEALCTAGSGDWQIAWKSELRKSYAIHSLLLMVIVLGFWFTVCLFLFEFKLAKKLKIKLHLQRVAAFAVDYCPAILILDGIALLATFRPYARALSALVSGNLTPSQSTALLERYRGLSSAPSEVLGYAYRIFSPYHLWIIFTAVLSAIALLILMRGFLRLVRSIASNTRSS